MVIYSKYKSIILLVAIIVMAIFFRFYKLDSIPPGLFPDLAVNGYYAQQGLQTGNFDIYYPESNGREGVIIWLEALSMKVFGISVSALKITTAIIGVLTLLGIYFLCRQLFDLAALKDMARQSQLLFHSNDPWAPKHHQSNDIALLAVFLASVRWSGLSRHGISGN